MSLFNSLCNALNVAAAAGTAGLVGLGVIWAASGKNIESCSRDADGRISVTYSDKTTKGLGFDSPWRVGEDGFCYAPNGKGAPAEKVPHKPVGPS